MDTIYLFSALLALMITALTALGYALQRISDTSRQFGSLPILSQPCRECGQRSNAGASHCSACGTSLQPVSLLVDATPHDKRDMHGTIARQ